MAKVGDLSKKQHHSSLYVAKLSDLAVRYRPITKCLALAIRFLSSKSNQRVLPSNYVGDKS